MSLPFHDLSEAYAWLERRINYERTLDSIAYNAQTFELEDFRRRLEALGAPHRGLRTIHIAGTRGKGSAALALETLLHASGRRTAVYTSPHLREYRERVRLDGMMIGGELFARLLGRLAQDEPSTRTAGPDHPDRAFKTVFENLTALFLLAARQSGVDWTIMETGLGGRLDATNVIDPGPVLLTRIGLEHTRLLGDTIGQIAAEKAAILKPGGWGVMAAQDPSGEAEAVFRARADQVGARLDRADALCPILRFEPLAGGSRVEIGFEARRLELELGLLGEFQAENLQNALAMFSRLRAEGLVPRIPDAEIVKALKGLRIPGRMEKVCEAPELYADGGHCPTAARALARTMAAHFAGQPAGLLVGMMQDKDHEAFFAALAAWPGWQWVWCYQGLSPRAQDPEALAQVARRHFHNTRVFHNLEQALQSLEGHAEKKIRIVATGSLYSIATLQEWGTRHGTARYQTEAPAQDDSVPDH